jgi:hypothetical protein
MMYSATASRIFHPQAIVMNWLHIALGLAALSASQPASRPASQPSSQPASRPAIRRRRVRLHWPFRDGKGTVAATNSTEHGHHQCQLR